MWKRDGLDSLTKTSPPTQSPKPAPPRPTAPGCYVYTPSGCPRKSFNAKTWHRDTWGENNRNADDNRNACVKTRLLDFNN